MVALFAPAKTKPRSAPAVANEMGKPQTKTRRFGENYILDPCLLSFFLPCWDSFIRRLQQTEVYDLRRRFEAMRFGHSTARVSKWVK
jgi:hypothetical protein